MGTGYGGYAALIGVTATPDTFACGVAHAAPSDLATMIESFPGSSAFTGVSWFHKYVGDPAKPRDRANMNDRSPLFRSSAVRRPVLILHDSSDPRVDREQAERMAAALRRDGRQVEYVLLASQRHSSGSWKASMKQYRHIEYFLASCLGGRSGGFDYYEIGTWLFGRNSRL